MTRRDLDKHHVDRPDWLTTGVWPYQTRILDLDGVVVSYTDEGEGPILLLVHDGTWSFVWGQVIERLRTGFRVVTLDFPGAGLSPESAHPPGLESDSALLERLVDALEISGMTLVLHDLGGAVGAGLAARRPELVEGMVFVNSFAWPPHRRALRMMLRAMSSTPVTMMSVGTDLLFRATSCRFGIGRHLDDEGRSAFLGPYRASKGPRRRFHTLMAAPLYETDYLTRVETALKTNLAECPVLTVFGERNDPFGFQERLLEIFPTAEQVVIPRGNHFPMCDDPDGFADTLSSWQSRIRSLPPNATG